MVRAHAAEYDSACGLSHREHRALENIANCRTAALGGHVDECDTCGHQLISYNSCRDRHCPKCQGSQRAKWLAKRMERLLPTHYFHIIFTLPKQLRPLALANKRLIYNLLFREASKTLADLARDPNLLGAQLGFTAVLHTWDQKLGFHPHLHCVVTGGGLSFDQQRWTPSATGYLFPVASISKLFRGKFLDALHRTFNTGELDFSQATAHLADPLRWAAFKDALYQTDWVTYAKQPFAGPEKVFRYLGRYTHRVAISNYRILDFSDGRVTISFRDRKDNNTKKTLILAGLEFIRRFVFHILPNAFTRIRHYGLLAGTNVNTKLPLARQLLDNSPPGDCQPSLDHTADTVPGDHIAVPDPFLCPKCQTGRLVRIGKVPRGPAFQIRQSNQRPPPTPG